MSDKLKHQCIGLALILGNFLLFSLNLILDQYTFAVVSIIGLVFSLRTFERITTQW